MISKERPPQRSNYLPSTRDLQPSIPCVDSTIAFQRFHFTVRNLFGLITAAAVSICAYSLLQAQNGFAFLALCVLGGGLTGVMFRNFGFLNGALAGYLIWIAVFAWQTFGSLRNIILSP